MNRLFIRRHINSFSILLFVTLFALIVYTKPSIIFKDDGSVRQFGISYKNKTVLPIWLATIILAFLSYLIVLSFLVRPQIR